ncbi:MAG: UDP-N-acetylmuramate dehydrogenase [Balneolaceae bacterium]|nr:UDP-N-acetylmuramate dehydrogenase [Balneolaceae bacterium]
MTANTTDLDIQKNVDLSSFNTLKISAQASSFLSITSAEQLETFCTQSDRDEAPVFVLGGGSNVLFADDFDGLILHISIMGKEVIKEDEEHVWLKVGAGENWHEIVLYCVENGWGGIENLSLIPGTAGAAPIQNIGAYGVELEEVFESLQAVHLETGERRTFKKSDCQFGYRDSIFKNELKGEYVVANVTLKLSKNHNLNTSYGAIQQKLEEKDIDEPTIKDISDIVIEIRNSKLPNPKDLGNAGSFFKNPIVSRQKFEQLKRAYENIPGYELNDIEVKVPAGWLIEQAGWKGKVVGNAGTYQQQALVIVNHGGATGEEILELARQIQLSVDEEFGISLVPEVNIVR